MFDLFSAHQIHFQLLFEVTERGKFPIANSILHLYLYFLDFIFVSVQITAWTLGAP